MHDSPLSRLRATFTAHPPLHSEDDILALLRTRTEPARRVIHLNRHSLSPRFIGVVMIALILGVIGVVVFHQPAPDPSRVAPDVSSPVITGVHSPDAGGPGASSAQRDTTESVTSTLHSSIRERITRSMPDESTSQIRPGLEEAAAPAAHEWAAAWIFERDRMVRPTAALPTAPLEDALYASAQRFLHDDALCLLAAPISSDSVRGGRDSVWNYTGVYLNTFYTTRSFTDLNVRLAAQGFPSISNNTGFGSGLSYEFARPGRDSAAPITFPVFLYPATQHYTPGFSVEWLISPEIRSADGRMRASLSSWGILADNLFFHTYRMSRLIFVLSLGVNLTSITVGRDATFDDVIGATDAGSVTMSRAAFIFRPALRYDLVLFPGLQLGFSAGYTFPLSSGSWRLRSSFEFDPGIAVANGPGDSAAGWHFGVSLTLRGVESMTTTP